MNAGGDGEGEPVDPATAQYYEQFGADSVDRWESIPPDAGLTPFFPTAFPPGSTVLDIGCGSGRDLARLCAAGHEVHGVEPSSSLRQRCIEEHPELAGRVVAGRLPDRLELPQDWPGSFDGIVCSAVLMHIPTSELPAVARALRALMHSGSRLLVSLPALRAKIVGRRDPLGRLFSGVTVEELQSVLAPFGLELHTAWLGRPDAQGRRENSWDVAMFEVSN